MLPMRIVITGAAGFIGSHLAETLARRGDDVVGVDAFTDYYDRALKDRNAAAVRAAGAELRELDLATDALDEVVAGADFVFHFAAQPGISASTPPEAYLRNNLTATGRLLDALERRRGADLLINISTSSVYGAVATSAEDALPQPTSWYGVTKLAAEHLVMAAGRERGLPTCSLRIFSVFGPRERPEKLYPRLIRCIAEDRPFPLNAGAEGHERSFTYVGDIVQGCIAAMKNHVDVSGEVINLGSEQSTLTMTGIRMVEEIMGRKARFDPQPRRPGDQQITAASIGKAGRLLDYVPKTTLREGLEAEVAWFTD